MKAAHPWSWQMSRAGGRRRGALRLLTPAAIAVLVLSALGVL